MHEYNDACCGVEHTHNADHYDSFTQVCCNPEEGYPSSRERSSPEMGFPYTRLDTKRGGTCGVGETSPYRNSLKDLALALNESYWDTARIRGQLL